jgi:kynurenine formamidase
LSGILVYSGVGRYWTYDTFDSWSYAYFYGPFLSREACESVVHGGLSFMGIDAFQLEHPLINFSGDALPLVLSPECREYVNTRLPELSPFPNHQRLLSNDVLIYENLDIPGALGDQTAFFSGVPLNLQLPELTDNALARPYAVLAG